MASSNLATVQAAISEFKKMLCPTILEFLSNKPRPSWVPPESAGDETRQFYHALGIPLVEDRPNLLLHRLGAAPNPYADALFKGPGHHVLYNTSGSGKTRILFDGLCRHWGFYFVVAWGGDHIGTPDFEEMIRIMELSSGWVHNIFGDPDPDNVSNANTKNERIASNNILKVLLARWIVFDTFIQIAREHNGGVLHDDIKLDWLLFQILPSVFVNGRDPFWALISSCFVRADSEDLDSLVATLPSPSKILGSVFDPAVHRFFYVLDEAHVAGRQYMGAFADANGEVPRPVLRPIIQTLTSASNPCVVILSGTGFSPKVLDTVLTSGVGKDSGTWDVVNATGDFVDLNAQFDYLTCYLPPSFLCSPSGDFLKARVYNLLRGRHRFTARYLEELMTGPWEEGRPAAPHKVLNAYVHQLADVTPRDGDSAVLEEAADIGRISIGTFRWDKIETERKRLCHSVYTWFTQGTCPIWHDNLGGLVGYGIARFARGGATIDEPLALVSIVRYFESQGKTLLDNTDARFQSNQGTAFEEIALFAITKALQGREQLGNVFQFHGHPRSWARCTAQIVTRTPSDDYANFDIIGGLEQPAAAVVFYAEHPEDVTRWLTSGEAGWCRPGKLMGPDLMTWLRLSNGELLLLVIHAKCHMTGNSDTTRAEVIAHAIRSVTPDNFFRTLTGDANLQKINAMRAAIKTTDKRYTTGKYNILRVVVGFPLEANFTFEVNFVCDAGGTIKVNFVNFTLEADFNSTGKDVRAALEEDKHALAILSGSALTLALQAIPDGRPILKMLTRRLKRTRGEDEAEDEAEAEAEIEIDQDNPNFF